MASKCKRERDFARLIPDINNAVKVAFSDLDTGIKASPNLPRPWRRFIHANEAQESLKTDREISEAEGDEEEHLIWTGHYRFSLMNRLLAQQIQMDGCNNK